MDFVAIDFETANYHRSSICSLGVAVVQQGRLVHTHHILVKPVPNYYDSFNSLLHGIDDSHTRHRPSWGQQWQELRHYFEGQTVVAHNAAFDMSVLRSAMDATGLAYPTLRYHCTLRYSQQLLDLPANKLSDVSRFFNIRLQHHHAESDAQAAALIALRLCERHRVDSLEQLAGVAGYQTGMMTEGGYKPFSKLKKKRV